MDKTTAPKSAIGFLNGAEFLPKLLWARHGGKI
jgi:hypothetical protein